MKTLSLLIALIFMAGTINMVDSQERRHHREHQEGMDRHEQSIEVTDLPQEVQETLREDYEEFRAKDAALVTDPDEHEESFYQVTLQDAEEQETKIVMIARDGEVIDEKDDDNGLFDWDNDNNDRDREYTPAAYQEQDPQHRRGERQERREGMHRQERPVEITDLPQEVQEKLREEYEDFNATDAALVTDPDEHDETFYQVKLKDREEEESKIVMIARDGEILDEKDDDEGLFDWDEDEDEDEERRRRDRRY